MLEYLLRLIAAPCPSPPPHVDNGIRLFIGQEHGRRARYICNNGFRLSGMHQGSPYLVCDKGRWMGGNPACQECESRIQISIIYNSNEVMNYIYKDGLKLVILCKTNNVMILDSLSFYLEKNIGLEFTDVWEPKTKKKTTFSFLLILFNSFLS